MITEDMLITAYCWSAVTLTIAYLVDLALGGRATLRVGNSIIGAAIGAASVFWSR